MAFKDTIKQNRTYIVLAGLGVGLLCAADATQLFALSIAEQNLYLKYVVVAIVGFAIYVFYSEYMAYKPKKKMFPVQPSMLEEFNKYPPQGEQGGN